MSDVLSVSGFDVLDQYAPAESPECSVLVVSYSRLLIIFSPLRAAMLFFLDNQSGLNFYQLTNLGLSAEFGIFWKCVPTGRVFKSGGCY